jgi:HK97 family phage major capsid protein
MMHPLIMASIVKLTIGSGDDRPMWQAGDIQRGIPDQLEGMKIFLNSDMASTLADGNKVLLAGDFDKFYVRETLPMVLKRTDERYIETDQVGFVAFARFDSVVADTTAIKYLDIT